MSNLNGQTVKLSDFEDTEDGFVYAGPKLHKEEEATPPAKELLALILTREEALAWAATLWSKERARFPQSYQKLLGFLVEHFQKHQKIPTRGDLIDYAREDENQQLMMESIHQDLKSVSFPKDLSAEVVLERCLENLKLCHHDELLGGYGYSSTREEKLAIIKQLEAYEPLDNADHNFTLRNTKDFLATKLPDPEWIVRGLLCEGTTLLAAPPKTGKSWLALDLCQQVATGGYFLGNSSTGLRCPKLPVLYLNLDTRNDRAFQHRLLKLAPEGKGRKNFYFSLDFPKGNIDLLRKAIVNNGIKLVVIDTFEKFRPKRKAHANLYSEDYDHSSQIAEVAAETHTAILLLHHTRKTVADDQIEEVSGTFGITGGIDDIWKLKRKRGERQATLFIGGRSFDEEEREWAIQYGEDCRYVKLGNAEEVQTSRERQKVLELLDEGIDDVNALATALGKKRNTLDQLIYKMVRDGLVERTERGKIGKKGKKETKPFDI